MKLKNKSKMRFILLIFIGLLSANSFAQLSKDEASVIRTCFQLAEMQPQNHPGPNGLPVLVIENNGVITADESLNWFGNSVEFITQEVIKQENINAYIRFELFQVEEDKAAATFIYQVRNDVATRFSLTFNPGNNHWFISGKTSEKL